VKWAKRESDPHYDAHLEHPDPGVVKEPAYQHELVHGTSLNVEIPSLQSPISIPQ
jgi:hypothetical protein